MAAPSYEIGRVPRTLVGAGALDGLGGLLDGLDGTNLVVIADQGVQSTGYIARVVEALRPRAITLHVVAWGEPTLESVDAAAAVVRAAGQAIVIGVGGGSALDIAKQAAVVGAGDGGVEPYLLCATPLPGRRPIVAIPTTSGTGAEVTRTCIVADRSGRKSWTWGDELLPDLVVLDPTAAATMPHAVTVGTGLDAFVHAIEACSGQRRNSVAAGSAQRALSLVVAHLPRVAVDGSDLLSRQAMQEAAYLAGVAIDNCGTGVAHSIGHSLGSQYHIPHGISVAVGLRAALEWNVDGQPDAYADAANALSCEVEEVPTAFATLCEDAGLRAATRPIEESMSIGEIADTMNAVENQPMLHNNARAVSDADREMLAERSIEVWHGLHS
ncbi:MAG: iron-containing alcohol dehydrogenase [Ilumatobacteraceae bacterium]|nr:iron-containing alcohol dehydrogenase [Ilumatobacteraceae bacterium]